MSDANNKKYRPLKPRIALNELTPRIEGQLNRSAKSSIGNDLRNLVESLSIEELKVLPPEMRSRLKERLSEGRISDVDRRAINKLLSAELVEMKYQSRLLIKGPAIFVEKTRAHLVTLSRLPIGRRLLRSLSRSGRSVTIVPAMRGSEAPPEDFRAAIAKGKVLKWQDQWGRKKTIRGIGTGSNTTIKYNPDLIFSSAADTWRRHPVEIGLAHELIHACDAAYGQLDPEETEGLRNYERQAIGLPPYEQKEFTENRFRAQWHTRLPQRTTY